MIPSYIDTLLSETSLSKYEKVDKLIFILKKYRDTGSSLMMFQNFLSKRELESKGVDFTSLFIVEYQKFIEENIEILYKSYVSEMSKMLNIESLNKEDFANFIKNRVLLYVTFETKSVIDFIDNIFQNINITPDNVDAFIEYIVENKNETNIFSLGYLDDFLLKFIFTNVINGNSPVMDRIMERLPDMLKSKDKQDIVEQRQKYIDILDKVNRDYQRRKAEYEKQIKEIDKKIEKISPTKKKGTPEEEYYKSIRKSKFQEQLRNIKNLLLSPFKETIGKFYEDVKRRNPFVRLFDYLFKQSLKIAKFIDKKYGTGIFADISSGKFGSVFDKLFGNRKKRKIEKLQRLKKYYETNFGEINQKLMKDEISKGIYGKDYNSIPDDKKSNVDKIVQSIINARLENASIVESILNEEIKENQIKNKEVDTCEDDKNKDKKKKRKRKRKRKRVRKIRKVKESLRQKASVLKREIVKNRRKRKRKRISLLRRKIRDFYRSRIRDKKQEKKEQEKLLKRICSRVCPEHKLTESDRKKIEESSGFKLRRELPEYKIKQQQQQQQQKQEIYKQQETELEENKNKQINIKEEKTETKEYRFLDESEHKKMLESISYETERDRKGRWFSRIFKRIFNVKGKRSSYKFFQKNFGVEKPKKPNIDIFKKPSGKLKYKNIGKVSKKPGKFARNIGKRMRSLGRLFRGNMSGSTSKMTGGLYGNKGATFGRAVGRGFGRAVGGVARGAGRFVGALGRLRYLRFLSLGGFFSNPVGLVILAIVLIIVITVGIMYAYYTVLKFIKLFRPAVEYSAEKAIDTYKMAEMEEQKRQKVKSALEERFKKLAQRKMSASTKDSLYDFSALAAGKAPESDLIVKPQVGKRDKGVQKKDLVPEPKQTTPTYDVFKQESVQEKQKQIREKAKEEYLIPDYNSLSSEYNTSLMKLLRAYTQITNVVEDTQNNLLEIEKDGIKQYQ